MNQTAPYPAVLADLVSRLKYRPGWHISLEETDRGQGSVGLTLKILVKGYDSYAPENGENYRVMHYMPVPPAAYNERSWKRWLLEQLILVEQHEACEFFMIDEDRPYAPYHSDGNNPYTIFELNDEAASEAGRRRNKR
jgi:hypothetical protein